jgi:hypothetical protein
MFVSRKDRYVGGNIQEIDSHKQSYTLPRLLGYYYYSDSPERKERTTQHTIERSKTTNFSFGKKSSYIFGARR